MKLRQKLAAVLATAMIVTSVPVVTMAESTNRVTTVVKVKEDTSLTTPPSLRVDLEDYEAGEKEVFYLKLENAEWTGEKGATLDVKTAGVTATIISATEVKVEVQVASGVSLDEIKIPLHTTVKTGEAKVSIVNRGGSTVSNDTFVFATTTDKVATVTVDTEVPSLYKSGEIADIIIEEAFQGAFANAGENNTIELTLQNDDFIFVGTGEVTGEYGFAGQDEALKTACQVAIQSDKQVLKVTLPNMTIDSMGQLTLKGIEVKSTEKSPELGNVTIDIDGSAVEEQRDVVVGKVASYGHTLSVKDDKAVEIVAGQKEEVEFTLKENIEGSMSSNREVEFKLDNGYFAVEGEDDEASLEALKEAITSIENDGEGNYKGNIEDVIVEDEKVVGFVMNMPSVSGLGKFTIKAKVSMGLEQSGDVKLTASGRAIDEELSQVIATGKKAIEVTTEAAVLKVGLKEQKTGKITITEADKEMIKKGKDVEILLPSENGITFAEKPEVTVTGDLQIGKVEIEEVKEDNKVTGQKVIIPVTRTSKTASTIEISNFVIDTDRTVAEGAYDIEIGGKALTANEDCITVEDFIKVATANTEDLMGANGLVKGTSVFKIGESTYTVNGEEKVMDAAPYIQNPGYTMVPVRFVAEAFGITGNNIAFSKAEGTATIFAGSRTIQLKNNSDMAVVNGVQVRLQTKVVVKDGRTYAPIGEVAQLLGISKDWDSTTKTATFINK